MGRTKRSVLRCRILKSCLCLLTNWTHLALTTGSFGNLYIRMPSVKDLFLQLCWLVAPATQYRPGCLLLVLLSAILNWPCGTQMTSAALARGILAAQFEYHFWGQNGTTLKACKIVNFNPKHLKLWNNVFQSIFQKYVKKKFRFIGTLNIEQAFYVISK